MGDMVYLKLQPYIQTSVANRSNHKLSFRYCGPFKVLQRIGQVAYKLDLPADCKIHLVIHVSQLKLHIPRQAEVSHDLSSVPIDPKLAVHLIAVLDQQVVQFGSSLQSQLLVQWSDIPSDMTTWEEVHDVLHHFPDASAWGQAVFQEGTVS